MSHKAIIVENLSKRYRIGLKEQMHDTLMGALKDFIKQPIKNFRNLRRLTHFEEEADGRLETDDRSSGSDPSPVAGQSSPGPPSSVSGPDSSSVPRLPSSVGSSDIIWALRGVSFEVKKGEVVGIIGRNGAGKSTLLKILARITEPTSGRAIVNGRIGSLLEVGTGMHQELTGRENIYLSGTILGMTKAEVDRKFEEIVEFAELGKFIDTPVKRYSSGMKVRLGFAIAAHLEPEILLVDEVLAVGDAAFQKKCLGKMGDVAKEGRTVLFVSHNMGAITRLCQRAFWLDGGMVVADGDAEYVVSRYLMSNAGGAGQVLWREGISNPGVDELEIFSVRVLDVEGHVTSNLDARKPFFVEIRHKIKKTLPYCRVGFLLSTVEGVPVFEAYDSDNEKYADRREPGEYIAKCEISAYLLNPGSYILSINAGIPNIKNLAFLEGVLTLNIEDTGAVGSHLHSKRQGVIRPKLKWECDRA